MRMTFFQASLKLYHNDDCNPTTKFFSLFQCMAEPLKIFICTGFWWNGSLPRIQKFSNEKMIGWTTNLILLTQKRLSTSVYSNNFYLWFTKCKCRELCVITPALETTKVTSFFFATIMDNLIAYFTVPHRILEFSASTDSTLKWVTNFDWWIKFRVRRITNCCHFNLWICNFLNFFPAFHVSVFSGWCRSLSTSLCINW